MALRALPALEQAQIGPGQVHERTWIVYTLSATVATRQIGGIGHRLRTLRRRADYRDDLTFSDRDVELALVQAREAIRFLDEHGHRP